MKRVVGIVQARMGSRRLPGKSLMALGRWPVLEWVLRRLRQARGLDEVVLATTVLERDEPLCELAAGLGAQVYRGSEADVLDRYLGAARGHGAEVVVRVCGDCPLVDAVEVDRIVEHHRGGQAEYSFNHIPALGNGYPDGLGAEVLSSKMLEKLAEISSAQRHREHVTAYIWDHLDRFRVETIAAPSAIAGPDVKLDVDTAEDLAGLERLVASRDLEPEEWRGSEIVATYRRLRGATGPRQRTAAEPEGRRQ